MPAVRHVALGSWIEKIVEYDVWDCNSRHHSHGEQHPNRCDSALF